MLNVGPVLGQKPLKSFTTPTLTCNCCWWFIRRATSALDWTRMHSTYNADLIEKEAAVFISKTYHKMRFFRSSTMTPLIRSVSHWRYMHKRKKFHDLERQILVNHENKELLWCQFCGDWRHRSLSSTNIGAANDDKVGIMIILAFQVDKKQLNLA